MAKIKSLKQTWNSMEIKWKVFAYLIGFCVIIIATLWVLQICFLDNFYRAIKENQIRNAAAQIETKINSDGIENAVTTVSQSTGSCVMVISTDGTVVTNSKTCMVMNYQQTNYLLTEMANSGNDTMSLYFDNNGLRPNGGTTDPTNPFDQNSFAGEAKALTLIYGTKVTENSTGTNYLAVLTTQITPVTATVSTLRIQLIYVTIGMVLLALIMAFLIAKNVSKPIVKINDQAKVLATGNYDVDFAATGYKEINELSSTLTSTSKELAKVETLRRELVANISHDLRTPLTLIAGYAEAMRDIPDENNYENAEIIVEEANRLASLVNDALNISKIQAGVLSLEVSQFSLTELVKSISNRMEKLVEKDGYKIKVEAKEDVTISGDENKLSQVIYNLLINAINYSETNKNILVTQEVKDNKVTIGIHDHGPGIDPENLPYIWERYYKVDKVHKRSVTGSGLGLSIVKSIVTLHQGECGVNSSKDGSTFYFTLDLK